MNNLIGHRHLMYNVARDSKNELHFGGRFIVFEGLDGAGTTTQTALLANKLDEDGINVIATKEPTDGIWGGIIRGVLKGELEAHSLSLCYAFMADRIDHIQKIADQSRQYKNPIILSDRYNLSYLAYQQKDTNKSLSWLMLTQQGLPAPELTFFLDVPPQICYDRMKKSRLTRERYESVDSLKDVNEGYSKAIELLVKEGQNIKILNGVLDIDVLHSQIISICQDFFKDVGK